MKEGVLELRVNEEDLPHKLISDQISYLGFEILKSRRGRDRPPNNTDFHNTQIKDFFIHRHQQSP